VRAEAFRAAGEMIRELEGELPQEWVMTVTDEAGQPVLTLRFSAIEPAG
jgi:hypothetical protein